MSTITFEIPSDLVEAHLHIIPKKEVRYYLVGLRVECTGREVRFISTDGTKMLLSRLYSLHPETQVPYELTIPRALLETAHKSMPKRQSAPRMLTVTVTPPAGPGMTLRDVAIRTPSGTFSGVEVDGKYPEYRRVIPSVTDGTAAQFDPENLGPLYKAMRCLGASLRDLQMEFNGSGPSILKSTKAIWDTFGIIMPLRDPRGENIPSTISHLWATR